jgi:hypothetical protein
MSMWVEFRGRLYWTGPIVENSEFVSSEPGATLESPSLRIKETNYFLGKGEDRKFIGSRRHVWRNGVESNWLVLPGSQGVSGPARPAVWLRELIIAAAEAGLPVTSDEPADQMAGTVAEAMVKVLQAREPVLVERAADLVAADRENAESMGIPFPEFERQWGLDGQTVAAVLEDRRSAREAKAAAAAQAAEDAKTPDQRWAEFVESVKVPEKMVCVPAPNAQGIYDGSSVQWVRESQVRRPVPRWLRESATEEARHAIACLITNGHVDHVRIGREVVRENGQVHVRGGLCVYWLPKARPGYGDFREAFVSIAGGSPMDRKHAERVYWHRTSFVEREVDRAFSLPQVRLAVKKLAKRLIVERRVEGADIKCPEGVVVQCPD